MREERRSSTKRLQGKEGELTLENWTATWKKEIDLQLGEKKQKTCDLVTDPK